MLPIESLVDVVSFLGYYDLGGLKLTTKLFSTVAHKCADSIRFFDYSDLVFFVHDTIIDVYRLNTDGRHSYVCTLELTSEENLAEFIADAFRNCTSLTIWYKQRMILDGRQSLQNFCQRKNIEFLW